MHRLYNFMYNQYSFPKFHFYSCFNQSQNSEGITKCFVYLLPSEDDDFVTETRVKVTLSSLVLKKKCFCS